MNDHGNHFSPFETVTVTTVTTWLAWGVTPMLVMFRPKLLTEKADGMPLTVTAVTLAEGSARMDR